jgi:hypothetical protein
MITRRAPAGAPSRRPANLADEEQRAPSRAEANSADAAADGDFLRFCSPNSGYTLIPGRRDGGSLLLR